VKDKVDVKWRDMSLFYPDQLWRFVPESIDRWDTELQKSLSDPNNPFWLKVEFYSESTPGILLMMGLFFTLWFILGSRTKTRFLQGLKFFFLLCVFLTISDFVAAKFLKIPIGRLKPRVNGIIPDLYQALSFPSNHAFNLIFCWTFFYRSFFVFAVDWKTKMPLFYALSIPIIVLVCLSRIVLREHFPLDILGGWILGSLFAILLFPMFRKLVLKWIIKVQSLDDIRK